MFLIRIELHNTTNYEPLHTAMARRSMTRTIPCKDGCSYHLPTGTYYFDGTSTTANVAIAAEAAAVEAGHRNAMIVIANAEAVQISNLPVAVGYRRGA